MEKLDRNNIYYLKNLTNREYYNKFIDLIMKDNSNNNTYINYEEFDKHTYKNMLVVQYIVENNRWEFMLACKNILNFNDAYSLIKNTNVFEPKEGDIILCKSINGWVKRIFITKNSLGHFVCFLDENKVDIEKYSKAKALYQEGETVILTKEQAKLLNNEK